MVFANTSWAQNYVTESFDETTFPPDGWQQIYLKGRMLYGTSFKTWYRQVSYGGYPAIPTHSGYGMASYDSWGMYFGSTALLITPPLNFSKYKSGVQAISFWLYRSDSYNGLETDTLNVLANTSASLKGAIKIATCIDGVESNGNTAAGWYKYSFDIPFSLAALPDVYLIFEAISGYDVDIFLDDISIDHIPAKVLVMSLKNDVFLDTANVFNPYSTLFEKKTLNAKKPVLYAAKRSGLFIYPNPSNGIFNIKFEDTVMVRHLSIEVQNMHGKRVFQQEAENVNTKYNLNMNLKKEGSGIYFVKVKADDRKLIRKIVLKQQ